MFLKRDRKLNRWQGYDYKYLGLYFITICTHHRQPRFGEIVGGEMKLNPIGEIVKQQLLWLHKHFPHIRLDEWVVMPNHVHMILEINYNFNNDKTGYADDGNDGKSVGTGRDLSLQGKPIYDIIGAFKTTSSKFIHQIGHTEFAWQRSFHDRVIRNDDELSKIRDYIFGNPAKWTEDRNNPKNFNQ
ncbi:MAG: hypothetical protein NTZ49_03735 [Candidatus Parcubacteria bacterium]|nr:hypothetical protein [Candidatus Parcubacteria bacterium]